MLGELRIREILCKPAVFSVIRKEVAEKLPKQLQSQQLTDDKALPESTEENKQT